MPPRSKPDIIRRLFAAYGSKDRKVAEDLLTDDSTFAGPGAWSVDGAHRARVAAGA